MDNLDSEMVINDKKTDCTKTYNELVTSARPGLSGGRSSFILQH